MLLLISISLSDKTINIKKRIKHFLEHWTHREAEWLLARRVASAKSERNKIKSYDVWLLIKHEFARPRHTRRKLIQCWVLGRARSSEKSSSLHSVGRKRDCDRQISSTMISRGVRGQLFISSFQSDDRSSSLTKNKVCLKAANKAGKFMRSKAIALGHSSSSSAFLRGDINQRHRNFVFKSQRIPSDKPTWKSCWKRERLSDPNLTKKKLSFLMRKTFAIKKKLAKPEFERISPAIEQRETDETMHEHIRRSRNYGNRSCWPVGRGAHHEIQRSTVENCTRHRLNHLSRHFHLWGINTQFGGSQIHDRAVVNK